MKQNETDFNLKPKQQKFILALFKCPDLSISAVSKKVGVSRSSFYRWLKNPNFSFALDNARNDFVKANLKDVDNAVLEQAKAGNVMAAKLIYERFDMLIPPRQEDHGNKYANEFANMTNEELNQEAAEMAKKLMDITNRTA